MSPIKAVINEITNSDKFYKTLFDGASEGILIFLADGTIIDANQMCSVLFLYTQHELRKLNLSQILSESQENDNLETLQAYLRDGSLSAEIDLRQVDFWGKRKMDAKFPIDLSFSEVQYEDHQAFVCILKDATISRQTEWALRREKEIAQQYLDVAGNMFLVINEDETVGLINQKGCEILGYQDYEIIGENWFDLFVPIRAREPQRDLFRNHFTGKQRSIDKFHSAIINSKGEERFILWHSSDLQGSDGRLSAVLRSGVDITKQQQVEEQLHHLNFELERRVQQRTTELEESQKLYRLIARNFPNGTINVFDSNLNYVFVEGRELFVNGITSDMLVGTSYLKRLPKDIAIEVVDKLKDVFNGKNTIFQIEHNENVYELNAVALFDVMGVINQILVVEQNITQQKRIEEELQKTVEKEKELNALKSRFVSMASHEFRTPLGTILSSVSLVERYTGKEQEEKRVKHINRIKSSVSNLTNILNDFLSLDRLETGKISLNYSKVYPTELFEHVIEEMQSIANTGQTIKLEASGLDKEIVTDRQLIRNILINLLSNAIKYSPENGVVEVKVALSKDKLNIKVKDYGMGIPKADQKHLFERFFRANNAANIQGTGLGLNIVKKYTDLLEGKISFTSTEGEGTTFSLSLPIEITPS